MNKLTLPIKFGNKYIRRDGSVTTVTTSRIGDFVFIEGGAHVCIYTGLFGYDPDVQHAHDLVADYIEDVITPKATVTGHIHAASMLLYAHDAAETPTPWKRWEVGNTSPDSRFSPLLDQPAWDIEITYRRKPPVPEFIDINGHQVPAPMRGAPAIGSMYWVMKIHSAHAHPTPWSAGSIDLDRMTKGICHATQEAAELHAAAVLSFTHN